METKGNCNIPLAHLKLEEKTLTDIYDTPVK